MWQQQMKCRNKLQLPGVCMNCSCADNILIRSGLFSQDQKNMVVRTRAARVKEDCRPQNLLDCPPFISYVHLRGPDSQVPSLSGNSV